MPTTTEICTIDLVDPSKATKEEITNCCKAVSSQNGLQEIWFGIELEDPDKLQIFSNWENTADHRAAYQAFEKLGTISDIVHVDFQPSGGVAEALASPCAQVATFYFNEAPPESAYDGAKTLIEALPKDGVKVMGWAYGTTHEVIEKDGVRGKGNKFLVGWESVEAHNDSWNTQALKDNIHRLTTPEVKGIAMHHVSATAI